MARPRTPDIDLKGIQGPKNGKYKVDVVRTMPDGQRFRRCTNTTSLEDAIEFRDKAIAEHKDLLAGAQQMASEGYTVESWAEHCLTSIMPTQASRRGKPYSTKTIDGYRILITNRVVPMIGSVRLDRLNVDHCDRLIGSLPTESLRVNVRNCLSRMMEIAEAKNKRPRNSNPLRSVIVGRTKVKRTDASTKIVTKERDPEDGRKTITKETAVPSGLIIEKVRVLTFDEEAALLKYVAEHPDHSDYLTLILLGLRAGVRIGEALGLDWSAVDFARNVIRIDQQATRVKGAGIQVSDPKSEAGFREIPMPKSLAAHLRGVKMLSTSAHVVCNRAGNRRDDKRASNRLKELMIGAGLNDKVDGRRFLPRPTFHDLRRTCLTRLATGRVAPGVVVTPVAPTVLVKISGHESVETLLSFYTTADDSMVVDAMASMP